MFSGFGSVFGQIPHNANVGFGEHYRCFPILMMPDTSRKDEANYGGKIFLPPLALGKLTMLHIRYPMLFELRNELLDVKTHTGVLEFTAEEGRVYIPQWAMSTLKVSPGQVLAVNNCDLPLGSYVKIQPQLVDFLDISDPKAVLENALRNFSTLTADDIIEINYNDAVYGIKVLEVKPDSNSGGICVVETDLETEFAAPVGYVEPEYTPRPTNTDSSSITVSRGAGAASMAKSIDYARIVAEGSERASTSFSGGGQKLSGKTVALSAEKQQYNVADLELDALPVKLELPPNQLFFGFPVVTAPPESDAEGEETKESVRFEGQGQLLRQSKKRRDKSASHPALKNHSRSPPEVIEID